MIWRMDEFDTDYSFLNLPEAGSDVRGPIGLPSIAPINFALFGGRRPIRRPKPEPIEIKPIRRIERGNDQARFEMGRAIGQEVNMLRKNIQTLEAAKDELVSERDLAIQMQDQIRQEMSEQKIQELDQQQARLQAELQEAVAAAEARGIDAVAEAEAQAAEELARVSADFQSQIDALTGERDAALAEQDVIRAEAADQQAQALEAQKQDYEARLGEMTGQVGQFETQLGERDQTIADLQAQIAGLQQAPAETPVVTDVPDIGPIPGFKEQFPYLDLLSEEPSQEAKDAFARSMETGEPVISPDQVQEMINRMGGQAAPVEAPEMPPKRDDQLFISDQPRFISEEKPILKSVKSDFPEADFVATTGQEVFDKDYFDRIGIPDPRTNIGGPKTSIGNQGINPSPTPIPPAPTITPPRRPMSVGGIGGMGRRVNRMMMR